MFKQKLSTARKQWIPEKQEWVFQRFETVTATAEPYILPLEDKQTSPVSKINHLTMKPHAGDTCPSLNNCDVNFRSS